MVLQLQEQKSLRLLKHIIRCYLRLTDNKKYHFIQNLFFIYLIFRALEGLKQVLPLSLKDGTFKALLAEDSNTTKFYEDLIKRIS